MNQFTAAKPKGSGPPPTPSPGAPQALEQARPADVSIPPVRRAPRRKPLRDVQVLEAIIGYLEQLPKQQVKRVVRLLARML